ncbi:MAG: transposase [Gammaproteobacteria bacterium]
MARSCALRRRYSPFTHASEPEKTVPTYSGYWGQHFWARGYFCAAVGELTEDMIKQYLDHHFEPDPGSDFKVEP